MQWLKPCLESSHYTGMPGIDRIVYGQVVTSAFTQTRKTVTLDGDHSSGQEFDSLHLHHYLVQESKMQEQFTSTVQACIDCVMRIEYGESPSPEHNEAFNTGMKFWFNAKAHIIAEEEYFSRSECDICESKLGGMRHDVFLEWFM